MVINTNLDSLNASRSLQASQTNLSKSLQRLSSGSKITSPEDDAAGLAVSMRFDAQIKRTEAAAANVSNAISFAQTRDGLMKKVGKALERMGELAILSQDITKSDSDRGLYNAEFDTLGKYVTNVASKDFNGVTLFSTASQDVTIDSDGNKYSMSGINLGDTVYTTATGSNVSTASTAQTALVNVKAAISKLASDRAGASAAISRLNYTSEQLNVIRDNLVAANMRIKDVNVAEESTNFARYNILVQAGTAMVSQANASPQAALRLLG